MAETSTKKTFPYGRLIYFDAGKSIPTYAADTEMEQWWLRTAAEDLRATLPKVEAYGGTQGGSTDLQVMGDALAEFCDMHDAPDAIKQELAVWFYALGKISRLISDYKQGKPGKADSWKDLTIYALMARRLQEAGTWP